MLRFAPTSSNGDDVGPGILFIQLFLLSENSTNSKTQRMLQQRTTVSPSSYKNASGK